MQEQNTIRIHHGGRMQNLTPEAVDTLTYELIGQLTRWALHDIPGLRVCSEEMVDIASDVYCAYLTEGIRGKYNALLGPWHLYIKTFVRRRVLDRVRKTARNWKNALIPIEETDPAAVQAALQDAEERNTAYTGPTGDSKAPAWSELSLSMRRQMLTAYRSGWLPARLCALYKEHLTSHTRPRRSPAPVAAAPLDVMAPLVRPKRRRPGPCALSRFTPGLADRTRSRRWRWQFVPPRYTPPEVPEPSLMELWDQIGTRRARQGLPVPSPEAVRESRRNRRYSIEQWLHMTASMDFLTGGPDYDRHGTNNWHMRHAPKDWERHMYAIVPPFELH